MARRTRKPEPVVITKPKNPRYISKKTRALVTERDGGKCTRCSTVDELLFHHVLPVSEGGDSAPENLVTLCWNCHKAVHIERGDWYAERMAHSKERWLEGREDFEYHQKLTSTGYLPGGNEKLAHLTAPEKNVLFYMHGTGWGDYPSLRNISKGANYNELQTAGVLALLIEKGYVKVHSDDKSDRYLILRDRLHDVFYRGVRYLDSTKNVIKTLGDPVWFEEGYAIKNYYALENYKVI